MASTMTVQGSNGHPDVLIKLEKDTTSAVFATSQLHMDHAEVGPWIPCLKLEEMTMKSMVPSAGELILCVC